MLKSERIVYCKEGRGFCLTAEADSVLTSEGKKMEEVITSCRACAGETEKEKGTGRWPCRIPRDKLKASLEARR